MNNAAECGRKETNMRIIIALLSILLLASCSKPTPAPKAPPAPVEPDCFAPAGNYMVVAGLQKHNCKEAPKETIVAMQEIKPKQLTCGLHKGVTPGKDITVITVIQAGATGLIGQMGIILPTCRAIYDVVFIKMK